LDRFAEDLEELMGKLDRNLSETDSLALRTLEKRLIELRERNLLKINHSVLEMVIARYLIKEGYKVELEHILDPTLNCDVYANGPHGTMIVEVETGYVPPSHALDPMDYIRARISSKIARYSNHCDRFVLAAPPHYIMPVPRFFTLPSAYRTDEEVAVIKRYCDTYYTSPPVSIEEIRSAKLHSFAIVDVDEGKVGEVEPITYISRLEHWYV
jgi:hypothetical protein